HVVADAGRVRQVLLNLIGNAVKFTTEGYVLVSAETTGSVGAMPVLSLSVRDTGIGIEPDKLEHIFEKFTQADASTARRFGGTGLGLAISKRLAEAMGGGLEVTSVPDE